MSFLFSFTKSEDRRLLTLEKLPRELGTSESVGEVEKGRRRVNMVQIL
jgi:hypothetical protein